MTKRAQTVSLKLALVTGVAVALFWLVWSLFGTVPEKSAVTTLFLDQSWSVELSRLWDILAAPLVVYLFSLVVFQASELCTDLDDHESGYIMGVLLGLPVMLVATFDQLAPIEASLIMLFLVILLFKRDVAISQAIIMTGLTVLVVSFVSGFAVGLAYFIAVSVAGAIVFVVAVFLRRCFIILFRWISSSNVT